MIYDVKDFENISIKNRSDTNRTVEYNELLRDDEIIAKTSQRQYIKLMKKLLKLKKKMSYHHA